MCWAGAGRSPDVLAQGRSGAGGLVQCPAPVAMFFIMWLWVESTGLPFLFAFMSCVTRLAVWGQYLLEVAGHFLFEF